MIDANNAVQDAMNDIQIAQMEYQQAQAFGDPIRQAQIAVDIARQNVANARGEAERLRALMGQMDAQRALQEAIVDVFMAWNDIAIAQREAAGDAVGAAQQELEGIKRQLDSARQMGDNMRVLELTAEQIRAEASVRDAKLNERQNDIDFALQMQQITTDQAIKQLELLLKIPGLTKDQIQDLQLKIKQLRDELSSDMQFNLPDVLMPTLYEARRLDQWGSGQAGYQGYQTMAPVQNNNIINNISITGVNPSDAQSVANAVRQVASQIAGPPRNSQTGRLI